jgi:glyoxylase-like metal-dependent hydrolase (beta-lactamase superfamily II)
MTRVRVRMYRQGLGDCFLLTFPAVDGERHVLIDCGVLKGTQAATTEMQTVAQNIMTTTGAALSALVVTHEHWDHVSGFLQASDVFKDLKPAQAWFAWNEDLADDLAQELSTRKKKARAAVAGAARRLAIADRPEARRVADRLNALLKFTGGFAAAPGRTTADGMAWPKSRPGVEIKYFRPGEPPHAIPGVDGVRVYVLGPPQDRKLIKKSDPSKKASEVYELMETKECTV